MAGSTICTPHKSSHVPHAREFSTIVLANCFEAGMPENPQINPVARDAKRKKKTLGHQRTTTTTVIGGILRRKQV